MNGLFFLFLTLLLFVAIGYFFDGSESKKLKKIAEEEIIKRRNKVKENSGRNSDKLVDEIKRLQEAIYTIDNKENKNAKSTLNPKAVIYSFKEMSEGKLNKDYLNYLSLKEENRKREDFLDQSNAGYKSILDQDYHEFPVKYKIGRHAKETLALRYGGIIAGDEIIVKKIRPAGMYISDKDEEEFQKNCYLLEIFELRNRKALGIIEKGTNYIKTFMPMEKDWFNINMDIELILKGNSKFSIKEIAEFHIIKGRRPEIRNPAE